MTTLQIGHLSVGYGKKRILTDISLEAHAGEILVLLGENGCGKTTLLRAVQGNIPVYSGQIRIGGTNLSGLRTRERAALVTTMTQEVPLEAGLTGMDRIEMGLYPVKGLFGRLCKPEIEYIQSMADTFGIRHLLDRDLSAMSTGERQMISLLRAAVQDTPVLLLDEPASALDLNRTEELFAMLHRLAESGKTILTVLHDPTQAVRHGDRLLMLEKQADGAGITEIPDAKQDRQAAEQTLRRLYPGLRIHEEPLFCYLENLQE